MVQATSWSPDETLQARVGVSLNRIFSNERVRTVPLWQPLTQVVGVSYHGAATRDLWDRCVSEILEFPLTPTSEWQRALLKRCTIEGKPWRTSIPAIPAS
jgi:hypothetical protein